MKRILILIGLNKSQHEIDQADGLDQKKKPE